MRKIVLNLSTFLFAFVLGTASVGAGFFLKSRLTVNSDLIAVVDPVRPTLRFIPYGRGCGNGYIQTYATDDYLKVAEGVRTFRSPHEARKELHRLLQDNTIVEHSSGSHVPPGDGGRFVLVSKTDQRTASILWWNGSDSIKYIDAPNLELALEFEKYLFSIGFRSPV